MKSINLTDVKEAGESTKLPAGVYLCIILDVEDFADREYLKVTYDIARGEFAGHFNGIRKEHPDWAWVGAYVKSYKPKALPMFKRFCTAVTKSNPGYVFDGQINTDEKSLIGKGIGLVLGEEEYYGNDGEKRARLYVAKEFAIDDFSSQKVPALKTVREEAVTGFSPVTNEPLPF